MTPQKCALQLTLVGYGFIIFGLIWVTTAFPAFDGPGRFLIDLLDWPLDGLPNNPSPEARWMGAIGAGLTCGMGFMFTHVFAPILRMNNPETGKFVKRGALLGVFAWYIVDGAGSISAGAPPNVVFNSVFLLLIAVPLLMTKFD